jgi:hypothetical protein
MHDVASVEVYKQKIMTFSVPVGVYPLFAMMGLTGVGFTAFAYHKVRDQDIIWARK